MVAIWNDVLKIRVDSMGVLWRDMVTPVRDHFNVATWNGVYDFVEFLTDWFPDNEVHRSNKKFIAECNRVLQRELSAYRFIGKQLVRLTTADEIAAVEEARERREPAAVVSDHLDAALRFMSDRDAPNFRNSIKESISAVESCCSLLAGTTKADLNGALQVLEKRTKLHPALKRAFSALYGYTSDADGVRHALLEESTLSFDDAKFMLVSCSAFINYVRAIAS